MLYPKTDSIIIENVLSSNNLKGIGIFSGSSIAHSRKTLKRAYIVGQNPDNPICMKESSCHPEEEPCVQ